MDKKEIRVRILEAILPPINRLGLNTPEIILNVASELENYVDNGYPSISGEAASESKPVAKKVVQRRKPKSPPKSQDNVDVLS